MIDHEKLLPSADILKKLDVIIPRAPLTIIGMAEDIAATRRIMLKQSLDHQARKRMTEIFTLKAMAEVFMGKSAPYAPPMTAAQAMNADFAVTGDNLREAIQVFMAENNITPARAGLNEKEIESLKYVAPPEKGYQRHYVI